MPSESTGYVYFIRCLSNGFIKIGYSERDPDVRFSTINTGSPIPLERFALMRAPRSTEAKLHVRFARYRKKGEWFRPHQSLLDFISENARDWRELADEERSAERERADAENAKQTREFQEECRRIEDHVSTCYMLGLDPRTATDADLEAVVSRRRRKPRMIDDLLRRAGMLKDDA